MMKHLKQIIILCIFITSFTIIETKAVSNLQVVNYKEDGSMEVLKSFNQEKEAILFYENQSDQYNNLAIVQDSVILRIEYGVVRFITKDNCGYNIDYKNIENNESGYINGCYAADGAYLNTNENLNKITFMIAGVKGQAKKEDVEILPIEKVNSYSQYTVNEGKLYHYIKTSFDSDSYSTSIFLGDAPTYLENGKSYYSYDGHYFYEITKSKENYRNMIDDYRKDSRNKSIQSNLPYYNYYLYLSHRTISNYTEEDLKEYFYKNKAIDASISSFVDTNKDGVHDVLNQSQYYEQLSSFFHYQNQFGSNALMMLSLSMNETASGKSSLSYTRNNLFGHAAYDSDVEKNAARYNLISNSVYSHGKNYISGSYLYPEKFQYHGGYFGDKASGMNVSYASDPYWGEKAARYYINIDSALGNQDYLLYDIGIKANVQSESIYANPDKSSPVLYETGKNKDYAFLILDEITNDDGVWYKIQADPTINSSHQMERKFQYNFLDSVGYIQKDIVTYYFEGKLKDTTEYENVKFLGNGGVFYQDSTEIEIVVKNGVLPKIVEPIKENAKFIEFIQIDSNTYEAVYKSIVSIEMKEIPKMNYDLNTRIDLLNGSIVVNYEDGTKETIPLTTSMVSGMNLKEEGTQVVSVQYGGAKTSYTIDVKQEDVSKYDQQKLVIIEWYEQYKEQETFSKEEKNELKDLILGSNLEKISWSNLERRSIDELIQKVFNSSMSVVIKKNKMDLQVSGLSLALPQNTWLKSHFIAPTMKFEITNTLSHKGRLEEVAKANNYNLSNAFQVSSKVNLNPMVLDNSLILSIAKPIEDDSLYYTVLWYNDGNVIRLNTNQTNDRVYFETKELGEFLLVCNNTVNHYNQDNYEEVNTVSNSDLDLFTIVSVGGIALIVLLIVAIGGIVYYKNKRSLNTFRHKIRR